MESQSIRILEQNESVPALAAYAYQFTNPYTTGLVEVIGWDDYKGTALNTGVTIDNRVVLLSSTHNPRELSIEMSVKQETDAKLRGVLEMFEAYQHDVERLTFVRTFYDATGKGTKATKHIGWISSIDWQRIENHAFLTLTVVCETITPLTATVDNLPGNGSTPDPDPDPEPDFETLNAWLDADVEATEAALLSFVGPLPLLYDAEFTQEELQAQVVSHIDNNIDVTVTREAIQINAFNATSGYTPPSTTIFLSYAEPSNAEKARRGLAQYKEAVKEAWLAAPNVNPEVFTLPDFYTANGIQQTWEPYFDGYGNNSIQVYIYVNSIEYFDSMVNPNLDFSEINSEIQIAKTWLQNKANAWSASHPESIFRTTDFGDFFGEYDADNPNISFYGYTKDSPNQVTMNILWNSVTGSHPWKVTVDVEQSEDFVASVKDSLKASMENYIASAKLYVVQNPGATATDVTNYINGVFLIAIEWFFSNDIYLDVFVEDGTDKKIPNVQLKSSNVGVECTYHSSADRYTLN